MINGVSCAILPGSVTAVIGPNGSGKSSLAMAAAGLLPLVSGEVRADGVRLAGLPALERARLIGYVPQRSELTAGLSVEAVVAMGRHAHGGGSWPTLSAATRQAVDEALAAVDATSFAGRTFPTLSGGERQRVLIARALAGRGRILVLDEPTSALDLGHRLAVLALVRRLAASGRAILVTLHELNDLARVADRAVLLDQGQVALAGTPTEVLAPQAVRAVYGVDLLPNASFGYALPARPTPGLPGP